MKHQKFVFTLFVVFSLLCLPSPSFADEKFSAQDFDTDAGGRHVHTGRLYEMQAAFFFLYQSKNQVLFTRVVPPGKSSPDTSFVRNEMYLTLRDVARKTGHRSPWTYEELDQYAEHVHGSPAHHQEALPILLRSSIADLMKDVKDAKGATIGLSNNNLVGGHVAWNGSGALGYLIKEKDASVDDMAPSRSLYWKIMPALSWNLAQVQGGPSANNIEDLAFSLPVSMWLYPSSEKQVMPQLWVVQARPYYQTDFLFGYSIYGMEVSVEPCGNLFGSSLYFGGFQNLGSSGLQYQVQLVPKLDYSVIGQTDIHTSRKVGDNWIRAGGLASLDFLLMTYVPLDIGASFETLQRFNGTVQCADLFSAYGTMWITDARNVALTFKYSKGYTMESAKKTDQVMLGLSYKY